jgi:hypothetical protein
VLYASPATDTVLGVPLTKGTSVFDSVHENDAEILRSELNVLREMTARSNKPQLMKVNCRMKKVAGGYFQARQLLTTARTKSSIPHNSRISPRRSL